MTNTTTNISSLVGDSFDPFLNIIILVLMTFILMTALVFLMHHNQSTTKEEAVEEKKEDIKNMKPMKPKERKWGFFGNELKYKK